MSNAKYTPGPWVAKAGLSNWDITTPYGQTSLIIARINTHRVEQAHNARLIAAAPELLEALKALMGHDDKMQVAIGGNPRYVDAFMERARAAIAKAEGGDT